MVLLVPLTFVSLVVSTLGFSATALGLLGSIRTVGGVSEGTSNSTTAAAVVGLIGFVLGLVLLATFAVKSWM